MPPSKQEKRARPAKSDPRRRKLRTNRTLKPKTDGWNYKVKCRQFAPVIRCSAAHSSIGSFLRSTMRSSRAEKQRRHGIAAQREHRNRRQPKHPPNRMKPRAKICERRGYETGRCDEKKFTKSHSNIASCGCLRLFWQDANSKYEKRARSDCKRCHARRKAAEIVYSIQMRKIQKEQTEMRKISVDRKNFGYRTSQPRRKFRPAANGVFADLVPGKSISP